MIASAAHRYLDRGLSIVPLTPGAKTPMGRWRRWTRERMTHEQVDSWWGSFSPKPNLGVITGGVSGGVNVIDIEPEHVAFVRDAVKLPETPSVTTARGGVHLYCVGERPCGKAKIDGRIVGDIRGNGGYVVAPPSTIGDGCYSGELDPTHFAPLPNWLDELRARQTSPTVPARHVLDDLELWLPTAVYSMLDGWRPGGCCESPSELDFRVICACIRAGATPESILGMLGRFPVGENVLRHLHRDPSYFDRTYDQAMGKISEEQDSAVSMRCVAVRMFSGNLSSGAQLRAQLVYQTELGVMNYTLPVLLGRPPRQNDVSGEWRALTRVYQQEPTPDARIDNREVHGVCENGRITYVMGDEWTERAQSELVSGCVTS